MLECHDLSFTVADKPILYPLSFAFTQGAITSVIGPNGAGKSTFLKALLGLFPNASGEVLFKQKPLQAWPSVELASQRAYVSQQKQPRYAIPVFEYLCLARLQYGETQAVIDAAVSCVLDELRLDNFANQSLDTLSGGEFQRVELARAWCQLHAEEGFAGTILILDEPASALDIHQSYHLYQHLDAFVQRGGSVIIVEHDINLAARHSHEMLILDKGRTLAAGKVEHVFTQTHLNQAFAVDGQVVTDETQQKPVFLL